MGLGLNLVLLCELDYRLKVDIGLLFLLVVVERERVAPRCGIQSAAIAGRTRGIRTDLLDGVNVLGLSHGLSKRRSGDAGA